MMERNIRILNIQSLTHDVRAYTCTKPEGYQFEAGQATELSINRDKWRNEKRPFTFTSLNDEPHLQFVIKSYNDHEGVTNELSKLQVGDELLIDDPWGAISYKGPGYFIAGGAGITPFIAILRQLKKEGLLKGNHLFFANKSEKDIILREELGDMLGASAVFLVDTPDGKHQTGYIDGKFLAAQKPDLSRPFYVCGPPPMLEAVNNTLMKMGVRPEALVFEK